MKYHGMNTITYLPDLGNTKKMVPVIYNRGQFNLMEGLKEANNVVLIYFYS